MSVVIATPLDFLRGLFMRLLHKLVDPYTLMLLLG